VIVLPRYPIARCLLLDAIRFTRLAKHRRLAFRIQRLRSRLGVSPVRATSNDRTSRQQSTRRQKRQLVRGNVEQGRRKSRRLESEHEPDAGSYAGQYPGRE
jgi:hypothetical protein